MLGGGGGGGGEGSCPVIVTFQLYDLARCFVVPPLTYAPEQQLMFVFLEDNLTDTWRLDT